MSTQVLVWLGSVMVALIIMAVLWALVWAAAWSVMWAWNSWPWRHELVDDPSDLEEYDPTGLELGHEMERLMDLPPERTWEQMTAHQLPVVGMSPAERKHWHKLERARKQRARRAEMTHRAHYAAMGFDYPSGLMARVRELTP